MSAAQVVFISLIIVAVLLYAMKTAVSYFCSCRDKEWIKWCEDHGFVADRWPEYGYGDDDE